RIDGERVSPGTPADAEPPTLTDRHELGGVDMAEDLATGVEDAARVQPDAGTQQVLASAAGRDEADLDAVGLGRGAQPELGGARPHLVLGDLADREQTSSELVLCE